MNFLAKHFEKIILAVCLLCLIWSIKAVSDHGTQEATQTATALEQMSDKRKVATGDKIIDEFDPNSFESLESMLHHPLLDFNFQSIQKNQNSTGAGLFDTGEYIICKNRDCNLALRYDADRCPDGHLQEKKGEETKPEDDLDRDGIPDLFEKEHPEVLHYRDPYDAMEDYDEDGFLNIEEYRAGTDLQNSTQRPPLAFLLRRYGKAFYTDLPITFQDVKKVYDTSDPNAVKGVFFINGVKKDVKAGGKLPDTNYVLLSFTPDSRAAVIRDETDGTEYTLPKNTPVKEKKPVIDFLYLASHTPGVPVIPRTPEQMRTPDITEEDYEKWLDQLDKGNDAMQGGGMAYSGVGIGGVRRGRGQGQDPMGGGMGGVGTSATMNDQRFGGEKNLPPVYTFRFRLHAGDTFVLQKVFRLPEQAKYSGRSAEGIVTEYYRILEIKSASEGTEEKDVVLVQQVASDGKTIGTPIEVPILDGRPVQPTYGPPLPGQERPTPMPASNDYFCAQPSGTGLGMGGAGNF